MFKDAFREVLKSTFTRGFWLVMVYVWLFQTAYDWFMDVPLLVLVCDGFFLGFFTVMRRRTK